MHEARLLNSAAPPMRLGAAMRRAWPDSPRCMASTSWRVTAPLRALSRARAGAGVNVACRLRICFVTGELLGAHKNGGIGTATTHLALFLARLGHQRHDRLYGRALDRSHASLGQRCEDAGVALTHLDARFGDIYPTLAARNLRDLRLLCGLDQDVILFQDWEGPAFASVEAKRGGLAFARPRSPSSPMARPLGCSAPTEALRATNAPSPISTWSESPSRTPTQSCARRVTCSTGCAAAGSPAGSDGSAAALSLV